MGTKGSAVLRSTCMTVGGAANTKAFRAYVREILVPPLREGDIV